MNERVRGVAEMTSAMVISGTVGWFVLKSGQPATTVVFWRCAFGAVAMLVICALLGMFRRGVFDRRGLAIATLGGVALVLNWVLLFSSYAYASISVATVIYHTQPFILVGFGVLFFQEKLTLDRVLWLLIAFTGMVLIVTSKPGTDGPDSTYLAGVLMAFGAAFFYAVAAGITKRMKQVPPHLLVLVQLAVGTVVLAPFASTTTGAAPDLNAWGFLATIGVVHTGLMATLLYGALQKISTSLVGALSFIYPVVAIVLDWVAFDYRLTLLQLAGTAAILLAVAGVNFGWSLLQARGNQSA